VSATPFVQQLRSSRPPVVLGSAGAASIQFRVEASDIWEAVRVVAPADAKVSVMKQAVVQALFPNEDSTEFVLKLRGWEMLDENAALKDAGVGNGAIILIAWRRRRPVR
jgi:hypothetical protein